MQNTQDIRFMQALQRQEEIEKGSLGDGRERFIKRVETAAAKESVASLGSGNKLLREGYEPVVALLKKQIAVEEQRTSTGTGGRGSDALKWIKKVGAEQCAYLTLKCIIDGFGSHKIMRGVALQLADLCAQELRYRRYQELRPDLFLYRTTHFDTVNQSYMKRVLDKGIKGEEIDCSDITPDMKTKLRLGIYLLSAVIHATGLVELDSRFKPRRNPKQKPKKEHWLIPSVETYEWMQNRHELEELMTPVFLPMVVPPLAWKPNERGGYRFGLKGMASFVRGQSKEFKAEVEAMELPIVRNALNRLQATPWAINRKVLEVAEQLNSAGGDLAGIPPLTAIEPPRKPADIATNRVARKEWSTEARKAYNASRNIRIGAGPFYKILATATTLRDEAVFWFPYSCDFRGRIYPITNYLTPQGDDLQKALLRFATGKPLGESGLKWLAIHGANCLGVTPEGQKVSRLTFAERQDYIQRHTDRIKVTAEDPWSDLWWTEADEPFQFLAFCFEWAAAHAQHDPRLYNSSLAVSVDGSCNGIQHFSAMFRDEVGGASVNLVPGTLPKDLYSDIAERTVDNLEKRATDGTEYADKWVTSQAVTRKLVKRPTMTFGYGSKKFGFKSQLLGELQKDDAEWARLREHFGTYVVRVDTFDKDKQEQKTKEVTKSYVGRGITLLADCIWGALETGVVKAFDGMAWFQHCAAQITKGGGVVKWTVPITGFPVRQEYFEANMTRIQCALGDITVWPAIYKDTDKPSKHKQRNSVSPNIIHSLDAAALMLTVHEASNEGLTHFAMVHDSYGTLAADMEFLASITRRAFVRLYTEDVAANLEQQFRAQAADPDSIMPPPSMGTLELSAVRASDYFFS